MLDGEFVILDLSQVGKDNVKELYMHELSFDIESITINNLPNLTKIYTKTSKLNLNEVDNLRKIYLYGDICDNETNMKSLAEDLLDRNGMAWGSVVTQNQDIRKIVEDDFIQKDWYFGCDKTINTQYQPQFEMCGILDIWESAEYGEGRTYAVADQEVNDGGEGCDVALNEFNNTDIKSENYLGKFNICELETSFLGTNGNHGISVLSLIAMDGTGGLGFYGVAPKSKFYMFKIANSAGACSIGNMYDCIAKANELNLDAMNLSYGVASSTTVDGTIGVVQKNKAIAFCQNNGVLCCANGNEGTNVINKDGSVTSIKEGVQYPNNGSFSIAVGSVRNDEKLSDFSTCSEGLDFMAFGGNSKEIESGKTYLIGTRAYMNTQGVARYCETCGTSYSAPIVTGMVLLAKNLFVKKYKHFTLIINS